MAVNVCVVRGECSGEPELRVLASGSRLAAFAVRVRREGEPTTSVPIAMWDPPAAVETLAPGAEVVVVGRVVRRFFRGARGPDSRVEVQADLVVRAEPRRLAQALRRIDRALEGLSS